MLNASSRTKTKFSHMLTPEGIEENDTIFIVKISVILHGLLMNKQRMVVLWSKSEQKSSETWLKSLQCIVTRLPNYVWNEGGFD